MKTRRAVSVGIVCSFGFLFVGLVLLAQSEKQATQIETLQAAMAQMQPLASEAVPECGTFFFASDYLHSEDGNPLPHPCNVRPWAATFSLGAGVFLVDDVGLSRRVTPQDTEMDAALSTLERE
jgi:hypothetical protein